jgi:hypothetical protein
MEIIIALIAASPLLLREVRLFLKWLNSRGKEKPP